MTHAATNEMLLDFGEPVTYRQPDYQPFETPQVPPELDGLELYEQDMRLLESWPTLWRTWRKAHPTLNLAAEIAKAHAWELCRTPRCRKKRRGAFLSNWFNRAESNGGRQRLAYEHGIEQEGFDDGVITVNID